MADVPEFDLKFLPDWLKEDTSRPSEKYANYRGESGGGSHDQGFRRDRDPRGNRDRRSGPGGPDRGRGKGGPGGGDRSRGPRNDDRRGPRQQGQRDQRPPREPAPSQEPLAAQIEFLPEEGIVTMVAREIKAKFNAYPVFTLARMFLERPKSHRVKIVAPQGTSIYQAGEDGPISTDPKQLEKGLFEAKREEYYEEKTIEKEAVKGNFTNVARCRLSGTLLGPTNHHAYQSSIRRLYEERFSRRMSFEEYRREIEVVTDPAVVEAWKEGAKQSKVFVTKKEAEPVELTSLSEAQQHFRQHYQPSLIKASSSVTVPGPISRETPDPRIYAAVRDAWNVESRFPAKVVGHLRSHFTHEGLHIFKHRKRIIFATAVRPSLFTGDPSSMSPGIAKILEWIGQHPGGSRKQLADAILPQGEIDPEELNKAKSHLATDLRWLVHAGHVIEFQNGTLDLPLPLKPRVENAPGQQPGRGKEGAIAAAAPKEEPATEAVESASSGDAPVEETKIEDVVEVDPEAPAEPSAAVLVVEDVEPAQEITSYESQIAETPVTEGEQMSPEEFSEEVEELEAANPESSNSNPTAS